MIIDAISYTDASIRSLSSRKYKHIKAFLKFLEKKLGSSMWYDTRTVPFGKGDLLEEWALAEKLFNGNVITSLTEGLDLPDEPSIRRWNAVYNNARKNTASGTAVRDNHSALRAALAEAQERYVWFTQQDYFRSPIRATTQAISRKGPHIAPERFVSFSKEQRLKNEKFQLHSNAEYTWVQSLSLTNNTHVYIPGQVISPTVAAGKGFQTEPLIRQQTTIGLATWPTLAGARLAGALEVIEREAYAILWLNQLTLPRVELDSIKGKLPTLDSLLESCERYRLRPHVVYMVTDAPTHAVAVILEDLSGITPKFVVGLKAKASLPHAVEGALLEALRARRGCRHFAKTEAPWDMQTPVETIGHRDRLQYWNAPDNTPHLEFLIKGEEQSYGFDAPWEYDSPERHLERVLAWCREKNFSCLSVSLGTSKANYTPWHIEMVVIPELHPIHLMEEFIHLDSTRLTEVPALFGYTPRPQAFTERPHPYS